MFINLLSFRKCNYFINKIIIFANDLKKIFNFIYVKFKLFFFFLN